MLAVVRLVLGVELVLDPLPHLLWSVQIRGEESSVHCSIYLPLHVLFFHHPNSDSCFFLFNDEFFINHPHILTQFQIWWRTASDLKVASQAPFGASHSLHLFHKSPSVLNGLPQFVRALLIWILKDFYSLKCFDRSDKLKGFLVFIVGKDSEKFSGDREPIRRAFHDSVYTLFWMHSPASIKFP